jgi:hypothetical protein
MSLKTWVLGRVQKAGGAVVGRADLPPREPALAPLRPAPAAGADAVLSNAQHLGVYGTLIAAVREELEHFVSSHVRLHLAIADHDRFLLTAIGVSCADDASARRLLLQFMREFKPEQVKRYLAREVIGALPNAAAIDLSQFAGLLDADARSEAEDDNEYAELLAALRSGEPATVPAYKVDIVGRWTEFDGAAAPAGTAFGAPVATPSTPLAGQRCDFDVEDGDGRRRVVLQSVIPGRRYMIGKGEGCDIRVNGSYTSRRHAEIWLENGSWRIADAGSTNGIRIEPPAGPVARCGAAAGRAAESSVELADGARIVLSAHAEGPAGEYPWLALRSASGGSARLTPIAAAGASMNTPVTPIHPPPPAKLQGLLLTARGAHGERRLEIVPSRLPISVGRSRNQALVVGRVHELVSGHHLDIVDIDAAGVQVLVHGDNGVVVDGVAHAAGTHFVWKIGQTMLLGAAQQPGPSCSLSLSRQETTA